MADGTFRHAKHQFLINSYLKINDTGEQYDLSNSIMQVAVKKDYSVNIFPYYVVKLQVLKEIRDIIKNNKITLYLTINQYSINEEDPDATEPVVESTVVSTPLRIFDHNLTELDEKPLSDDADEDPVGNQQFALTLQCIPDDLMILNDEVINDVFVNATIDDALVEILGDCNNVYIDVPDNKERYETLLIPPLNRSRAIKWLDKYYGIYKSKTNLFFDTDGTYLTNQSNTENKVFKNTYNLEVLKSKDISSSYNVNVLEIDDEGNIRKVVNSLPTTLSINDVASDLYGGLSVIGSYGSEFDLDLRTYKNSDNNKVRYFWNEQRDVLFEEAMLSSPKITLPLIISDLNPALLSIKTKVNVHSYDELYNGIYTITSISTIYTTVNKNIFKCSSLVSCVK